MAYLSSIAEVNPLLGVHWTGRQPSQGILIHFSCPRACGTDMGQIRGFRIELGEIDKWVAEHPLCQENVTLLRRNEDEEKQLVTYIVPNLKQWKIWLDDRDTHDDSEGDESMFGLLRRFRELRDDLREFLKTKLPSYAIPAVILPLRRMPLNPNGKIDKPALPFPTADEIGATNVRQPPEDGDVSLSEREKEVADIWGKVIPHVAANVRIAVSGSVVGKLTSPRISGQTTRSSTSEDIVSLHNTC